MLRQVVYKAEDMKLGMTAQEIWDVMSKTLATARPRFTVSLSGKVQSIKIEEKVDEGS